MCLACMSLCYLYALYVLPYMYTEVKENGMKEGMRKYLCLACISRILFVRLICAICRSELGCKAGL